VHLHLENMRDGYVDLGNAILEWGEYASPRGEDTIEVLGAGFTLHNTKDALPVDTGRGVVTALAVTEALQAIGGFTDAKRLIEVAPHFANFTDEDGVLRGAYGPRLAKQIPLAIERIERDADTRQALVTIWQPELDNELGLHDYPCTISLQWAIRKGKLVAFTHMRSNDFWLGVPYDVFMFTRIQHTIASVLGVEPGTYHHHANSLHIYDRDAAKVDGLHSKGSPRPRGSIEASSWEEAVDRARMIHQGVKPSTATMAEAWMYDVILRDSSE
jgi:thymidylate synthase